MANVIGAKQLERIFAEIRKQSDRGAAIVATSFLEQFMERAIMRYFRDDLPEATKQTLFEGVGPLATFSAKVHLAFALGILTAKGHSDLRVINRIRNTFAHDPEPHRFRSKEIAARVASLHGGKSIVKPPRGKNAKLRAQFLGTILVHTLTFISAKPGRPAEEHDALELLAWLDKLPPPPRFPNPLPGGSAAIGARRPSSSRA